MKNLTVFLFILLVGCAGLQFKQTDQTQIATELSKSALRTGTFLFLQNNPTYAEKLVKTIDFAVEKIDSGQLLTLADVGTFLRDEAKGTKDEATYLYLIGEGEGLVTLLMTANSVPPTKEMTVIKEVLLEVRKIATLGG